MGDEFIAELKKNGIEAGDKSAYWLFNDLIIGVGRRRQKGDL